MDFAAETRRAAGRVGQCLLWTGLSLLAAEAAPACPADCDRDDVVLVSEAVRAVGIALGAVPLAECDSADHDDDGDVDIGDLVSAVSAALHGCTPPKPTPTALPEPPPAHPRLNEVGFLAEAEHPAFVEIEIGERPDPSDLSLRLEDGERFDLPPETPAGAPGGLIAILFDGGSGANGSVVHAAWPAFGHSTRGGLELLDRTTGERYDAVVWGEGGVSLGRGGSVPPAEPGMSVGRGPADPDHAWVSYGPSQATPGTRNLLPGVEAVIVPDGSIVPAGEVALAWYPVPGAVSYRVEVRDVPLAARAAHPRAVVTRTVASSPATVRLEPGTYAYTVTALYPTGQASAPSPPMQMSAVPNLDLSHPSGPGPFALLPVPLYLQRKDTALLNLEIDHESGPFAWNRPHPATWTPAHDTDPVDSMYCVPACISMINAYAQGLRGAAPAAFSQDRIVLGVTGAYPGPEWDFLNVRGPFTGLQDERITGALVFALGAAAYHLPVAPEALRLAVRSEIDAGRPVLISFGHHARVIVGYVNDEFSNDFAYVLADPWDATIRWVRSTSHGLPLARTWTYPATGLSPRADEPALAAATDDDNDGLLDFDEVTRFGTSPARADSDSDCIPDRVEVRNSVFDGTGVFPWRESKFLVWPQFGAFITAATSRDEDGDGARVEHDGDDDGSGVFDGQERNRWDSDRGGIPDLLELDAGLALEDAEDDPTHLRGAIVRTYDYEETKPPGGDFLSRRITAGRTETYDLAYEGDGTWRGTVRMRILPETQVTVYEVGEAGTAAYARCGARWEFQAAERESTVTGRFDSCFSLAHDLNLHLSGESAGADVPGTYSAWSEAADSYLCGRADAQPTTKRAPSVYEDLHFRRSLADERTTNYPAGDGFSGTLRTEYSCRFLP